MRTSFKLWFVVAIGLALLAGGTVAISHFARFLYVANAVNSLGQSPTGIDPASVAFREGWPTKWAKIDTSNEGWPTKWDRQT
jgi:hypothetical protein